MKQRKDWLSNNLMNPAPPGRRHEQALRVAKELHRLGFYPEASFVQLRSMYAADVPDLELRSIIKWCNKGQCGSRPISERSSILPVEPNRHREDFVGNVETLLKGFRVKTEEIVNFSPIKIPNNHEAAACEFFASLYSRESLINIVTQSLVDPSTGKGRPVGAGLVLPAGKWIEQFRIQGIRRGPNGAWIRMNPVINQRPGNNKGFADDDVALWDFALLESDQLALELQAALLLKLPVPIAAIIASGGRSLHAWVKVKAASRNDYRTTIVELFKCLKRFGFDQANKNPSRLSRFPGVKRENGSIQELLYLNPNPLPKAIV